MQQRYATFSLLLINITRCVQRIKNVEMAALGLKGREVQCLFSLFQCREGATLKQLCEMCGEDKGMMSRTVKQLTAEGLVFLRRDGERKYRNPILLTKEGEKVAEVVSEKISENLGRASCGISDGEREELYRLLGIVSENLTEICRAGSAL